MNSSICSVVFEASPSIRMLMGDCLGTRVPTAPGPGRSMDGMFVKRGSGRMKPGVAIASFGEVPEVDVAGVVEDEETVAGAVEFNSVYADVQLDDFIVADATADASVCGIL